MNAKIEIENKAPFESVEGRIPEIVFAEEPGYERLYKEAWRLAYKQMKACPGAPQSPFMDESFAPDRIWIWDTCFMALYCKYAPDLFPGVESLENFYRPLLDDVDSPLMIHIPDNPPLFTWAEHENLLLTGDGKRVDLIFKERRCPQRHFEYFDALKAGTITKHSYPGSTIRLEKTPSGYHWTGGRCGMDNTPRGDFGKEVYDNDPAYRKVLFLDALAQQALSAKIIGELTGETSFIEKHRELCALLNERYWDEEDGIYYDIEAEAPHSFVKVKTPASFWPLLAGACSPEQARRLAEHASNPRSLGGEFPFPSVSRDSVHFEPEGRYWRGGIWLPTSYMAIKGLERNGHEKLADELAGRTVRQQYLTWREFEPHTIWEAYSPSAPLPSNRKYHDEGFVRPDFCGWSALGPICLMIENVVGISVDAPKRLVSWRVHHRGRHGVEKLRFGGTTCDLIHAGDGRLEIVSDGAFTLDANGERFEIRPGKTSLRMKE